MSKGHRFARAHIDAPEVDGSLLGHDVFHEVEIAYRDAARSQDKIGLHGLAEFLAQALNRVLRDSQAVRDGSCAAHRSFEQVAIAVADFTRSQWLVHIDHFVAGSQNGDVRAADCRYSGAAKRCQDTDFPGADLCSTRQHVLSASHILASGANIVARLNRLQYLYPLALRAVAAREFYLDNGIGSRRHWRARHNAHSGAISNGMLGDIAGGYSAGNAQVRRPPITLLAILAKQRKTVHGGVSERWHILICADILCKHKAERLC